MEMLQQADRRKVMKWRVFSSTVLVIGLIVIGSLTVAEESAAQEEHPLDGIWIVSYVWEGPAVDSGSNGIGTNGITQWFIAMNNTILGVFVSGTGDEGIVLHIPFFSEWGRVFLISRTGCRTIYRGNRIVDTMSGTMKCRDYKNRGVWDAQKQEPS